MALFPGLPGWAGTRKVKPIWILLKQETVSGSSISLAICKSAPSSRQITMPAPHHSVFYRPDALPAAQPTASKHWTTLKIHDWLIELMRVIFDFTDVCWKSREFQWINFSRSWSNLITWTTLKIHDWMIAQVLLGWADCILHPTGCIHTAGCHR